MREGACRGGRRRHSSSRGHHQDQRYSVVRPPWRPPEEKRLGQRFTVSVDLEVDTRPAAAADDLKLTVDYAEVIRTVEGQLTGKPVYLIETLAQQIAARILGTFPVVKAVTVEVTKPFAPVAADFEAISVKIRRERV